jgi:hypothetical protein
VRRRNARRLAKQAPIPDQIPTPTADPDLALDLDAALLALPEKFRSPIVLCHLLGFSRADAAERLGCPEGTLSSWLSRGLAKLRAKLGGLDPAKPLGLAAVSVPTGLASSAVKAAVASNVVATTTAAVSSTVSQVVEGVIRMFWVKKATAASVALFAVFAFGVGVGLSGRHAIGVAGGQEKTAAPAPRLKEPLTTVDIDREIAELEKKIEAANLLRGKALEIVEIFRDNDISARAQKVADDTAVELKSLKDKLDNLKALTVAKQKTDEKPKTDPRKAALTDIDEIEKQIADLRDELAKRTQEANEAERNAAEAAAKRDDALANAKILQARIAELKARQAELAKPAAANAGGHLELTIHGQQALFQFSIKETDAAGKVIGRVITSELEMLTRLLARAQQDPTAPKEVRIVVGADTPFELEKAVLDACKAAKVTQITYPKPRPPGQP